MAIDPRDLWQAQNRDTLRSLISQQPGEAPIVDLPWVDSLAQNILLTVQAVQRLHSALDGKFTGT